MNIARRIREKRCVNQVIMNAVSARQYREYIHWMVDGRKTLMLINEL
jgi:hypothetical protein